MQNGSCVMPSYHNWIKAHGSTVDNKQSSNDSKSVKVLWTFGLFPPMPHSNKE